MQVGDKLLYHGQSGAGVIYGERVTIVRLIAPCVPEPDGTVYTAPWCVAESRDEDDIRFLAPQSWFHRYANGHCGICRSLGSERVA